ncbi:MAG: hypothetical protein KDD82_17595 [Planctomycetes bacterium]|nr:hypothetical protein [Planctomycetota bacterium]
MTSFASWARARGASLEGERVRDFGDPELEARALREGAGLWGRAGWEVIRLGGGDRLSFLHKYCTQDVAKLPPGRSTYACCLTVKGTLVGEFTLHAEADAALLVTPPGGAAPLLAHLGKYAVFDDVQLALADDLSLLSVYGPAAPAAVAKALGVSAPEAGANLRVEHAGASLLVGRDDPAGVPGFDLFVPSEGCAALAEALAAVATPVGEWAVERLRVEQGWPLFGVDMSEKTIPTEAGLKERAVSFSKGCYLGQEVVVRIEHRGHVNRSLVGLSLPPGAGPAPLPVFLGEKEVGQVTTISGEAGIGILHRKATEPDTRVRLGAPDGPEATVCGLPRE